MPVIELESVPHLDEPIMLAAFEGWNDAGEAASGAVQHLQAVWNATPLAEMDPEDYYDFQVNRPVVGIEEGKTRRVTWPTTRFFSARLPGADRDLVLVHGVEPNMRWKTFCAEIVELARRLNVSTVLLVGALLADAPHTRPVPVTGSSSDPRMGGEGWELEQSRYEGPTGIVGVLADACADVGLKTASLWASVPHYVAQPPSPKATLALLRRIEDVLDVNVPLGELPEQARAWERGVNELAEQDTEVAEYVRSLEEQKDAADLPEASGEAIAREFERYLRRRGDNDSHEQG